MLVGSDDGRTSRVLAVSFSDERRESTLKSIKYKSRSKGGGFIVGSINSTQKGKETENSHLSSSASGIFLAYPLLYRCECASDYTPPADESIHVYILCTSSSSSTNSRKWIWNSFHCVRSVVISVDQQGSTLICRLFWLWKRRNSGKAIRSKILYSEDVAEEGRQGSIISSVQVYKSRDIVIWTSFDGMAYAWNGRVTSVLMADLLLDSSNIEYHPKSFLFPTASIARQ